MQLGYNTNGLSGVDAIEAIELLHTIGYAGIALTLDQKLLNPYSDDFAAQIARTSDRLQRYARPSVIETGARFLLDANVKHEPTLMTADPHRRSDRVEFLCRAIDAAAKLGSSCVSLWSGIVRDGAGDKEAMGRLV